MSTPTVPRLDTTDEAALHRELADVLDPSLFPATIDELQASLIRRRAPARLLWCLSRLSPLRRYACLSAVLSDLEHPSSGDPREPL